MKKWLKWITACFAVFFCLLFVFIFIFLIRIDFKKPNIDSLIPEGTVEVNGYIKRFRNSFICTQKKDEYGISEIYLKGDPVERGTAFGELAQGELYEQEKFFIDQINVLVPSERYLKFLRLFAVVFNRNLGENIPLEYRQEICAMSRFCSSAFDFVGPAYERQLFYHAAHDIGHIMQGYMLAGCTSFAAWGDCSSDSQLIVGRNFDFYVGDDFARNKLVNFYVPDKGYKFVSIGWAGMVGVLSGMNDQGLCITINAAKGDIPFSSATPVSILAREILQYASTIEEAYTIAQKYKTFISESFLVASALDGHAVIIEKTPSQMDICISTNQYIVCANHFQSPSLASNTINQENISTSDSFYRYLRMDELIKNHTMVDGRKISPKDAADILRDYRGLHDEDIGLGNTKCINQFICHHSVIFKPSEKLLWISTRPWQMGEYVCYDLKEIFADENYDFNGRMDRPDLILPTDQHLLQISDQVKLFRKKSDLLLSDEEEWSEDEISDFIQLNPTFYHTYEILGDYYFQHSDKEKSCSYWAQALQKEIPSRGDEIRISKKIKVYDK